MIKGSKYFLTLISYYFDNLSVTTLHAGRVTFTPVCVFSYAVKSFSSTTSGASKVLCASMAPSMYLASLTPVSYTHLEHLRITGAFLKVFYCPVNRFRHIHPLILINQPVFLFIKHFPEGCRHCPCKSGKLCFPGQAIAG